jgi:hypothetical protein
LNSCCQDARDRHPLSQGTIVAIVRDRLDQLLPEPLADVRVPEAAERKVLRALLAKARGASGKGR